MKAESRTGRLSAERFHPAEAGMKIFFALCTLLSGAAVVLICWFLISQAVPAFSQIGIFEFLGGSIWNPEQDQYGILPMILSTIYVSALSLLVGVPLGLGTAIFLVFFCPPQLVKAFRFGVDLLAGIPSIVFGLFGLCILVPLMQWTFDFSGKGMLTASILLGLMIVPTVVSMGCAALEATDPALYENSAALGAGHERSVITIVCRAARSGLIAAVVLALGRAVGETMAVLMVAGNSAVFPESVFSQVRTLTASIVLEMGYAQGLHREALIATASVLLILVLLISLLFQAVKYKDV